MAVVHPTQVTAPRSDSIDIAGTAWPMFKLEALAAGLVIMVLLILITGSPQIAVLAGAAAAAVRWIAGLVTQQREAQHSH
ncbi:hypothetical protein HLB23_19990 [Nocardia uniformis]|uniref:Uncharacterized protein n=1 Tax=Nocardia uniformis TaxID=53432 RepID=A0A849CFE1_9NOCA|nr:hypothetical protein [Nocardia uniformis]NNH72111.1 hypothetical protein [Nocardia uniformis]